MVFSSITFLYYFLPIVLLIYFIVPSKFRNLVLLISSLFFYFYGEPRYILVLLFSVVFNYYMGKLISKENSKYRKVLFISDMIINFGLLFYFKYFDFFIDNINQILNIKIPLFNIIMPIGISFFTFQATSYVIDIYLGKVKSANSILDFAAYLSLFPQLIAGPIVRYQTIDQELKDRSVTYQKFADGVKRFIIGLSKKVLLANVLGVFSNSLSSISTSSVLSYWLQAISNTLQLYLDFSGYSDMAIGLGLMFGFTFLENFNHPFIASSITEFWHRWHISLSTWFRDYVYIPLGGSRVGKFRNYLNILIVWMITGLWHGASWNFVFWGLYFACFLVIEKIFLLSFLKKHKLLGLFYTNILVVISFVIFNQTTVSGIYKFLTSMFGLQHLPFSNLETIYYLKNYFIVFIVSILCSTPIIRYFIQKLNQNKMIHKIFEIVEPIIYISLLLLCTSYIIDESYNPFLYFRF